MKFLIIGIGLFLIISGCLSDYSIDENNKTFDGDFIFATIQMNDKNHVFTEKFPNIDLILNCPTKFKLNSSENKTVSTESIWFNAKDTNVLFKVLDGNSSVRFDCENRPEHILKKNESVLVKKIGHKQCYLSLMNIDSFATVELIPIGGIDKGYCTHTTNGVCDDWIYVDEKYYENACKRMGNRYTSQGRDISTNTYFVSNKGFESMDYYLGEKEKFLWSAETFEAEK